VILLPVGLVFGPRIRSLDLVEQRLVYEIARLQSGDGREDREDRGRQPDEPQPPSLLFFALTIRALFTAFSDAVLQIIGIDFNFVGEWLRTARRRGLAREVLEGMTRARNTVTAVTA
jgi:hypothetical protein